jgi:isopentenyldiphosphate isomerase
MNLTHREVVIYIFNSKGELLLQQRSLQKKINPGRWTISAVGHVDAQEEPSAAIIREVKKN